MAPMDEIKRDDPLAQSLNLTEEHIERLKALKELFPQAFTEKKVDFTVLRELLGDAVEEEEERYSFNWKGKRLSRKIALTPSTKTLRPCKEESKDWDTTENLFIEGDNLEVLKLLQKSYVGAVKMIYIDPPYNTGSDFVYNDRFAMNAQEADIAEGYKNEEGETLTSRNIYEVNTKNSAKYHTNWLNMMYPRLMLARNLLRDDGVIFISIDDNEVANLRKICDEIFGEECFVTIIHIEMSVTQGMKVKAAKEGNIVKNGEFILVYSKGGHNNIGTRPLLAPTKYDNHYSLFIEETEVAGVYKEHALVKEIRKHQNILDELLILNLIKSKDSAINIQDCYTTSPSFRKFVNDNADKIVRTHDTIEMPDSFTTTINDNLIRIYNSPNRSYLVAKASNGIFYQKIQLSEKINIADDFFGTYGPTKIRGDWWDGFYLDMGNVNKEGGVQYNNGKKPIRLIRQIIRFCCSEEDIILDFFAGSSTTAHSVMEQNSQANWRCKYIMVQLPESLSSQNSEQKEAYKFCVENSLKPNIAEISKERIRRAAKKIKEENPDYKGDLGFKVFKTDSSNIKAWRTDVDDIEAELPLHQNHLKDERSDEDILYELMLKLNIRLTESIESREIAGKTVYAVAGGKLLVSLPQQIKTDEIEPFAEGIIAWHRELDFHANPDEISFVFRDSAFATASDKANLAAIFEQAGLKNLRSL